jgi:hypothetical protein
MTFRKMKRQNLGGPGALAFPVDAELYFIRCVGNVTRKFSQHRAPASSERGAEIIFDEEGSGEV